MAEIYEYNLKLTREERSLLLTTLIEQRNSKMRNDPCYSSVGCYDYCPVYDDNTPCELHLIWIKAHRELDNLINKLENIKEVKENA